MKTHLYRIAALLLMAYYYLPIAIANTKNYVLFGISIFIILWVILVVGFGTERLFSKTYRPLYLYLLIYAVMLATFWKDSVWGADAWRELFELFIAISLVDYFVFSEDRKSLNMIIASTMIFIGITCSISIAFFAATGISSRAILTLSRISELGYGGIIDRLGIPTITYYYGLALIMPAIVATIKSRDKWDSKKVGMAYLLIVILISLFIAEYATALLLGVLGTFFALLGVKKFKVSLILAVLVLIMIFIAPSGILSDSLNIVAQQSQGEIMSARLEDLSFTLDEGIGRSDTHVSRRADRIPALLKSFAQNPIFGTGFTTGHSYWLDHLSLFGMLGMLPWFFLIRQQYLSNYKLIDESFRYYLTLTLVSYLVMGVMKGMYGLHFPLAYFFLAPGLYFSNLYQKAGVANHRSYAKIQRIN